MAVSPLNYTLVFSTQTHCHFPFRTSFFLRKTFPFLTPTTLACDGPKQGVRFAVPANPTGCPLLARPLPWPTPGLLLDAAAPHSVRRRGLTSCLALSVLGVRKEKGFLERNGVL